VVSSSLRSIIKLELAKSVHDFLERDRSNVSFCCSYVFRIARDGFSRLSQGSQYPRSKKKRHSGTGSRSSLPLRTLLAKLPFPSESNKPQFLVQNRLFQGLSTAAGVIRSLVPCRNGEWNPVEWCRDDRWGSRGARSDLSYPWLLPVSFLSILPSWKAVIVLELTTELDNTPRSLTSSALTYAGRRSMPCRKLTGRGLLRLHLTTWTP